MSSIRVDNINKKIVERESLISFLQAKDTTENLKKLKISWADGSIESNTKAAQILSQEGYIDSNKEGLNRLGILLLSRICIDLGEHFQVGSEIGNKYLINRVIKIGKNSATFQATHKILSTNVVLKVLRPGASEEVVSSLQILANGSIPDNIIKPSDYFEAEIFDIFSNSLNVSCIVFPYIEGETLRDFLNKNTQPISSHFVVSFIKQVSMALSKLEAIEAYHGDLHEDNIIVNFEKEKALTFNVIDVSFGAMGSLSSEVCHDNDLTYFRQHLWKILSIQQSYLPKMSIRKHLGSKAFNIVSSVLSEQTDSFSSIYKLFENNVQYRLYSEKKKDFLDRKFSPPNLFKLQRYEEITDPSVAIKLFVPFPELMDKVKEFSNIFIAGNRGSGKSTYLASLAFFPKTDNGNVDFKDIFGVYFPCRMGEFRLLSSEVHGSEKVNYGLLKQVIIIKVVRRVLEILTEAIERGRISEPLDYTPLSESLESLIDGVNFYSIDSSIVSEIRNFTSTFVRLEMKEIDNLYEEERAVSKVIKESDLYNFFKSVQKTFAELENTQFHLLFDDAGQPHVPEAVQHVMNDLVLGSNSVYCLKFSAEKFTYSFTSSTDKNLENGHDYFEYDISAILFIGSKTTGLKQSHLEQYFREIIEQRLRYFDYKSHNIVDYLGDDQVKNEQLINSLATSKRNAYYCGWSIVWSIADRTPRNLLEIVAEIFSAGNVDKKTTPEVIQNRFQDRAIRIISEKRLHSLNHISGTINLDGKIYSLGKFLFEITTTIGSTFRVYLKAEKGKKRKRQYLAIERNDSAQLSKEAEIILNNLISYGIVDSAKLDYARDDQLKKPIYVLNRIFCPAFGISPTRDNHLKLSKGRLEQLLLQPSIFRRDGTKILRENESQEPIVKDLFGGIDES